MTLFEIYWLAGIIEGEGTIVSNNGYPRIKVFMTDKDVIERVSKLLKSKVNGPYMNNKSIKPVYGATLCGKKAHGVLMTIYSILGVRRQEKIKEVLGAYQIM